jgi:DNA-directed RNA polymerase alpha subunit
MSEPVDVLPEQSDADQSWEWADRNGMERELYYALVEPWEKGVTIRVLYALANSRILTRAQIVEMGRDKLLRVRNLGPKGIAFIRQRLNEAANHEHPDRPDHAVGLSD